MDPFCRNAALQPLGTGVQALGMGAFRTRINMEFVLGPMIFSGLGIRTLQCEVELHIASSSFAQPSLEWTLGVLGSWLVLTLSCGPHLGCGLMQI